MPQLRRIFQLSAREWIDMIRAQHQLALAWLRIRTRSKGALVRLSEPPSTDVRPDRAQIERSAQLALAVHRAARFGVVSTTCLVRATALHRLLRHDGISAARVRVGVRMQNGSFDAHAWVELGELVLGDRREHVRTFTPVNEIRVALV